MFSNYTLVGDGNLLGVSDNSVIQLRYNKDVIESVIFHFYNLDNICDFRPYQSSAETLLI